MNDRHAQREAYFVRMVELIDAGGLSPGAATVTQENDDGFTVTFWISNSLVEKHGKLVK